MTKGKPRTNGFNLPYRVDQVSAWIIQPVTIFMFSYVISSYMPETQKPIVLGFYIPFIAIACASWIYCQSIDPSTNGGIPCVFVSESQSKTRFCAACKKSIPGMDHHCKWLNTCIGKKNYFQFYLLSIFGTLSFFTATLSCLIVLISPKNDEEIDYNGAFWGVTVSTMIVSGTICAFYTTLFTYHTYLLYIGKSTFDKILHDREIERNRRRVENGLPTANDEEETDVEEA